MSKLPHAGEAVNRYMSYGRSLLKQCEVSGSGRMASQKIPFLQNAKRAIDLREAKQLIQEAKTKSEMERMMLGERKSLVNSKDLKKKLSVKKPTERTKLLNTVRLLRRHILPP